MIFAKCACCGRKGAKTWYKDKLFCDECVNNFGTCHMCEHSVKCEFRTNPAPIPKVVTKHVREQTPNGYFEQVVQVPNAQRIKAFCIEGECKCMGYVGEEPKCMRQFGVCADYLEHEF